MTCAKCGSALSTGEQFCPSCGEAATDGSAVATFIQPAAVPTKSGSSTLKIVLITVAVIVGLGILGVGALGFTAWRISKGIHVAGPGSNVTITASDLGTEIYPGAQSTRGAVKADFLNVNMVMGVYLTPDSQSQVLEFYKGKLGSSGGTVSVQKEANKVVVRLRKSAREDLAVTISANSLQDDGKTKITIAHTMKTKAF